MRVVPLDEAGAHVAGKLLAASRTSDVVDAAVVALAVERRAVIVTGDPEDIERLVRSRRPRVPVVAV